MSSKITRTALGLSLAAWSAALSAACGSSDEPGGLSGSGADGSGASAGTTSISVGGTSSGPGGLSGMRDGGSVELTPDEVDAIANAACAGWSTEGENLPAVLQLVVDVSFSMTLSAPGSNGSKWQVTREALRDAIAALPDSVSLGILYYPNQETGGSNSPRDIDACVNVDEMVPINLLGANNHREVVEDSLDDVRVASYTPTHDAYRYALAESLIPYQSTSRKFMLLITDGAPTLRQNCIGETNPVTDQPTQPIVDEIAGAFDLGVRTFLIGSPGSEESSQMGGGDMRPWLSRAAIEGGTASPGCEEDGPNFCHMDMTQEPDFAAALEEGLASVVGQVVDSCVFAMPTAPSGEIINPDETNLIINWTNGDSTLILPDNTGDCSEGWQFTGSDQITLCSDSCDAIKADPGATVQLTFGCTVDQVIPVR